VLAAEVLQAEAMQPVWPVVVEAAVLIIVVGSELVT
jgi:hypothetical protein